MTETKYSSYTSILILTLILLPACKFSKQQPSIKIKPPQKIVQNLSNDQTYKERKETIKKKLQTKKRMHDELPSRIKDMNENELIKGKEYCLELGYVDLAIKHIERLITLLEDSHKLKKYRLELADLYFEEGEFEKSGKLYAQYLEYYPGSDQREYVEYKRTLCRFYMTLDTDRDQTKTKETLALAQSYLEKSDVYSTYVQDVQQIQHASYVKLVESEKEIIAFYVRRNKYKAAENRLALIKNNYLTYTQEYEPEIIKLEIQLADAQGNSQKAEAKKIELATRFPTESSMQLASRIKTDHVTKF